MPLPPQLEGKLALPAIAAPMFLVSWPELVIESCKAGVLGTFPSLNARSPEELDQWLNRIEGELAGYAEANPEAIVAPYGVNIMAHRTNPRAEPDLEVLASHKTPVIVTSVGNPRIYVETAHAYGGIVLHDVTTIEWARKAADLGVDGLIPVCGGAGGHAGTMNPFAMVPQLREFFDGTIALAGRISDGRGIRAAQVLGADLAYIGTRFVATRESVASEDYKQGLIDYGPRDLIYTPAFSGIPANMLRPSIERYGLDPEALPEKGKIDLGTEFIDEGKVWADIWTAGQGLGSIHDAPPVAELIARMKDEYAAAA